MVAPLPSKVAFCRKLLSLCRMMPSVNIPAELDTRLDAVIVALDAMYSETMLGTIAGDDTVFIVTRSEAQAGQLANELKKMI